MDTLVKLRSEESLCRERAALEPERRVFWLAQAQKWEQRSLDEIAHLYRERNLESADVQSAAHTGARSD